MTPRSARVAWVVFAFASVAHADPATKDPAMKAHSHGKAEAVIVDANTIKWGEAPPDVPKGAQIAVLHGDPTKAGQYTIRLKFPDAYKIPPHWHTQDEQLTVLSGKLVLHMGDTMTADPHDLEMGAYHFLPGKMHHAAEAKGETVVQISGAGPFDIHYLNPADNPNPKTAKK